MAYEEEMAKLQKQHDKAAKKHDIDKVSSTYHDMIGLSYDQMGAQQAQHYFEWGKGSQYNK